MKSYLYHNKTTYLRNNIEAIFSAGGPFENVHLEKQESPQQMHQCATERIGAGRQQKIPELHYNQKTFGKCDLPSRLLGVSLDFIPMPHTPFA